MNIQRYNFPTVCPEAGRRRNVFERLTDHRHYTGIHRERFDEFGNGRGRAGREYLHIIDGWAPCPSRPNEVYSSVQRKPRKSVVEPGTLGVQKFGVQAVTPKLIWLYRNGDESHEGEPFFVKHYMRDLRQLFIDATKSVKPMGGPVRRLYDQNFQQVLHVAELVDGAKYLCTSGEPPAPMAKLERFLSCWVLD